MDSLGLVAVVVEEVLPGGSLPGVHGLPGRRSEENTLSLWDTSLPKPNSSDMVVPTG